MKITDLTLTMIKWGAGHAQYGTQNPLVSESQIALVTIETDEGVTGQSFLGASYRSAEIEAWSMINVIKPTVLGCDPFDRSAIHEAMMKRLQATSFRAIGAVDVALWDLAGKVAGLPVHKLIGTHQQSVPVYASSPTLKTDEAYVELALQVKEAGYVGYKTHPPVAYTADQNIVLHQKIRDAVGPGYRLMVDAAAHLDYGHAMKLGVALKEMDYYWFEDPLPHTDIWTYAKLCEKLQIPVMATEYQPGGFHFYAPWITMHATDILRGDVTVKGGITPCLMTAFMAHGFHMNYEVHHGGNSVNNIANLHLIMALPNSEMFEVLLPTEAQKFGVINDLDIDKNGHVRAPEGPGLGVQYDHDAIKHHTVGVLR
jgi:L-alanine-DL-glutamate epimerase-like enolase superfamily enzyme